MTADWEEKLMLIERSDYAGDDFMQEIIDMCLEAAREVPQVRYVGWDVAITENGPTFIEANQHPGHDILQMPPHVPDKIGILPRLREFIDI